MLNLKFYRSTNKNIIIMLHNIQLCFGGLCDPNFGGHFGELFIQIQHSLISVIRIYRKSANYWKWV